MFLYIESVWLQKSINLKKSFALQNGVVLPEVLRQVGNIVGEKPTELELVVLTNLKELLLVV